MVMLMQSDVGLESVARADDFNYKAGGCLDKKLILAIGQDEVYKAK